MMETTTRRTPDGPRPVNALGDPDRSPVALTCRAALLLLAASEVGQNLERLAARTGSSRSFVSRCARRLLDHGVWHEGRTVGEWGGEGAAHPSFWNDVAVAEGKLGRRTDESGEFVWVPVGDWIKYYEYRDAAEANGSRYVPHPRTLSPAAPEWDPGAEAEADLESGPEAPQARRAPRAAAPGREPAAWAGAGPRDRPAGTRPAPVRPRPRPMAEDPVGSLFPDAQWMG